MWEKIKERGFGICAVAIGCSNLGMFIAIALTGASYVYEDIRWILYLEIVLVTGFIIWGIERLKKDT